MRKKSGRYDVNVKVHSTGTGGNYFCKVFYKDFAVSLPVIKFTVTNMTKGKEAEDETESLWKI